MEDFVKVFIVGLFIFALAIVILGQAPVEPSDDKKPLDKDVIFSKDALGDIGLVSSRSRVIKLGNFAVGYTLGRDKAIAEDKATIENGWFRKNSKEIQFSGFDADKAIIEFDVVDMNDYGNLTVSLNGNVIYAGITPPREFMLVLEDIAPENNLVISATSSGFKFWAPTTYLLENIDVVIEKYDDKSRVVPFEIFPYEYEGWGHGTLSFSIDDTDGLADFMALINGRTVYEGRPLPGDIIEKRFTKKDVSLMPGENLITFKTRKGVSYNLENVELTISYYAGGESNIKIVNFNSDRWWKILSETANVTGEIRFFTEKVNIDSGLTVYFNDRIYEIPRLKENEWYTLEFRPGDLKEKDNELKFSATGSYRLGALEIKVAAKE